MKLKDRTAAIARRDQHRTMFEAENWLRPHVRADLDRYWIAAVLAARGLTRAQAEASAEAQGASLDELILSFFD